MAKYFKEMNESQQESITNTFVRNANDLRLVFLGCTERIVKAFFLLNGGGAITVLTYINRETQSNPGEYSIALSLFLAGLIFTFILVIADFLFTSNIINSFKNEIVDFYGNKIPVNKMKIFENKKTECSKFIIYTLGLLSSLCAILGIAIGIYVFLNKP